MIFGEFQRVPSSPGGVSSGELYNRGKAVRRPPLQASHFPEELKQGQTATLIQQMIRYKNSNTTAKSLRSLGLEEAREALEMALGLPK